MGEKARSEMLSSGGAVRVTSFDMSPVVLFAAVVPVEGLVEPKRPDIVRWVGRSAKMDGPDNGGLVYGL